MPKDITTSFYVYELHMQLHLLRRSAFVPVVLLRLLKRFTSGRVTISETSDTTRNTVDWIVMSLVNIVVMAAQTEPRTNHIDTSCVVKPSQSNINIAKTTHTIGIYCSIGLSPSFSHNFNTILYISQTILSLFYAFSTEPFHHSKQSVLYYVLNFACILFKH